MKRLLGFGAAIVALTYFLDPKNGARRRNTTRDRASAFFRQSGKKAESASRTVAAEAQGLKKKAARVKEEKKPQRDDTPVAAKGS
jgi:hypothetical protein